MRPIWRLAVRADASVLPFADDCFDAILLINMLLFPAEVDRLLRPDGVVVWVNTLDDQTPIHLPPADVLDALPGDLVRHHRPRRHRTLADRPPVSLNVSVRASMSLR